MKPLPGVMARADTQSGDGEKSCAGAYAPAGVSPARLGALALAAAAALLLSACGERPQVINYKQGTYQGKADTLPYSNAPFNGNKQEWEHALRTRAQAQNEYKRIQ